MSRTALAFVLSGCCLAGLSGCSHFVETRAITSFMTALENEDLAALKAGSSSDFEQKALRRSEAVDDLKVLRLPAGEAKVVKVEDVSESEKNVTATIGESETKLLYRLARDEESGQWVVNDIDIQQKKQGLKVTRSVTEQMDLLLSVREFLAAWDNGDRKDVMAVTTPEFGTLLGELAPAYLARLGGQIVADNQPDGDLDPDAQLDNDVAVVVLPRSTGKMVLSLRQLDGGWKVDDLAIESRSEAEHIASLKKTAIALGTAVRFLKAYGAEDRKALQQVCTDRFYTGGLAPAELSTIALPTADVPAAGYELKMQDRRADFILPTEKELVKVSLVRLDESEQDSEAPVEYRVEEVTLYELDGSQEKRLSSLFTSHAMLELFAEALSAGNLAMIRKTSTADFNQRVWYRVGEADAKGDTAALSGRPTLGDLPLKEIRDGAPRIVGTTFQGALTEITAMHGGQRVKYQLRDNAGDVRVDDVLIDLPKRPASMKETVGLLLPVRTFAASLQDGQLGLLQRMSSGNFNKLVWEQVADVPQIGTTAARYLRAPLTAIEQAENNMLVTLGDERFGAKVLLVKDHTEFVVDEALLINGVELSQRARLKQEIRRMMAEGQLRTPAVVHAGYTLDEPLPSPALPQNDLPRTAEVSADDDPTGLHLLDMPEPSDSAFTSPDAEPVEAFERSVR